MADFLFKSARQWDLGKSSLPAEIKQLPFQTKNANHFSEFHDANKAYSNLNVFICEALVELAKQDKSAMAATKVGKGAFASEWTKDDGTTIVFSLPPNGKVKGGIKHQDGTISPIPAIGNKSDGFNSSSLMLLIILKLYDENTAVHDFVDQFVSTYQGVGMYDSDALYYLSDAVYYAVNYKGTNAQGVKVVMTGGNISTMDNGTLRAGSYNGEVLCGEPKELLGENAVNGSISKGMLFGDAKKLFETWRNNLHWSKEEEELIPKLPDDYILLPETLEIAKNYVESQGMKKPMVNFGWRGVSGYGKSEGVKAIAALLGTPLLVFSCNADTETQDFLTSFIPVTDDKNGELPDIEEVLADPDSAYEKMTGLSTTGALLDDVIKKYIEMKVAKESKESGVQKYKLVEGAYIKGLIKGYVVEVQEFSLPKSSGALAGLNEYSYPGAVIPKADGTFARRHPNALVVFTDNVGYAARRPVDQSVTRRMSKIFDINDLDRDMALERVKYNTGFGDDALLDRMTNIWEGIRDFCKKKQITSGTVSICELENWAQAVMLDGYGNLYDNCINCVVTKATSDPDEQEDIISGMVAVELGD